MLLRQIEYFQAVVETGSFYAAGERCHVSQSAISQQIIKLEEELNVRLLDRHNRTFSLTPAGEHFYRKSLVIVHDIEQMIRETKRIDKKEAEPLRLGFYKGYHGNEFSEAVALFSEQYPEVEIKITSGSHEELYRGMERGTLDLALNDQRRAFSGTYHNVTLSESRIYVELSARNPLSRLEQIELSDLKNTPCILVTSREGQEEERRYYEEIVGIHSEFLFSDSLQEARLRIITGQGYLPVDVIGEQEWFDTSVSRIPLMRNGSPIEKSYCAFWKRDNSNFYVERFAELLKQQFSC